jgi:hypothetical protein
MKPSSLSLSRHALSVCAAGVLFVGCGGPQAPTVTPASIRQSSANRYAQESGSDATIGLYPDAIHRETLHTRHVQTHCGHPTSGFHAHGVASGPFPGSFTASGTFGEILGHWSFNEKFTIRTRLEALSGTIQGSGSENARQNSCGFDSRGFHLTYMLGSFSGRAYVTYDGGHSRYFKDVLYKL